MINNDKLTIHIGSGESSQSRLPQKRAAQYFELVIKLSCMVSLSSVSVSLESEPKLENVVAELAPESMPP